MRIFSGFVAFRLVRTVIMSVIGAVIIYGVTTVSVNFANAQSSGVSVSDGSASLQTLVQRAIPVSDRIDLARRFLGVTDQFNQPTQPLHVYNLGDQETFWAENGDTNKKFQVTATLIYTTAHVFMWFDSSAHPDFTAVKKAADTFENSIYPTVHKYYGSEHSPGIDGDVHLYVLNAHGLGGSTAGYFVAADTYPKTVVRTSNQHNMFLMNLDAGGQVGSRDYEGTLAHEFQHMVHNVLHPNQQTWMNEGLSEVSRLLNHYADHSDANTFLNQPLLQLNTWDLGQTWFAHYGAGYLFNAYFVQRFDADKLHTLITDPGQGLFAFDGALKTINAIDSLNKLPITTTDLFADWQAANYLNDLAVSDGRYGYKNFPETLLPAQISGPLSLGQHNDTTNQYGTNYLELTKPGTYTFKFQGQPTVKVIPINAHSGSKFWWAGREDASDTRLTRAFDLSGVKIATLDFWTAYVIEDQYDYGYVAVSTDNGLTWKALPAPAANTTNPNDQAYGPGFTGISGISNLGNNPDMTQPPKWIEQKIDLTSYAGQKIMIRFEYITDDAMTYAGFAIDDISIPEIGYSNDAEAPVGDDGGWQSEGWARIDNTLPQNYLIQQINVGTTPATKTVKRLLGPADGTHGQWTISVDALTPRVVIAVAGLTRFTNESAPFSYDLEIAR